MSDRERRLGETIQKARRKRGLPQEQLAEQLDITPAHLKHIENGRRLPSVPVLFHMMELLDFSVDELVFPKESGTWTVHTDGLTPREIDALERLVEALKA